MDARRSRGLAGRAAALVAVVAVTAGLSMVPPTPAGATPPTNPSNGQLQHAKDAKASLADRVGSLSAQVAGIQNQVQQKQAAAELDEQKFAYAQQLLAQAQAEVTRTRQRQVQAQRDVDRATREFSAFVRASYMGSPITGMAAGLFTADDPNALLSRGDVLQYVATHKQDVIGGLTRAKVAQTNTNSAARAAEIRQAKAKDDAEQAKSAAETALSAVRQQQQVLNTTLASTQSALASARLQLATLTNQRARYVQWRHDEEVAAARAAAAQRAADAARAAAAAAARQATGGGGSWTSSPPPPVTAPVGGSWTPAVGQAAVDRAMHYLGIAYAFAAGDYDGPTYGVCVSGDAWNDCHVFGFDCSGLSLYAWGPWAHYDHYAATQYGQAGSYHPDSSALLPGDLVFWSSDGTVAGIHHVAIYIGGGNVIQAPQSGDIVRVTPLWQVDSGYFGATRPLT